jgi:GAF domain-containing protein
LTSQITARVRASNDPQEILQTAMQELRKALQATQTQIVVQTIEPQQQKNA